MPEKLKGDMSLQKRREAKESGLKVLAFEGREIFKQTMKQVEIIRIQMDNAQTALKTDMDSVALRDVYKMASEGGVQDKSYDTDREGRISKYSGEAQVEINGRKYKAVGHGPEGTAEYVDRDGYIEFIPQEIPSTTRKSESLSPEQESLFRMSTQQLNSLNRRVDLAEKTLSQGFNQFTSDELEMLALECGIENKSYNTIRWGVVSSYSGEAEVVIKGQRYKAIGHEPEGTVEYVDRDGYIEWQKI
ncbi:hypothetical protein KKF60_02250 [Patescibacteria group bacterium]|nr:hypothetical protein [Patescibacteria group bacterium]MBU4458690.1 hypothetical protein [Patescibacteria group bacterium]MCG2696285.1 hypothetical protein [Candidatus Portnoybacteria bacterium]